MKTIYVTKVLLSSFFNIFFFFFAAYSQEQQRLISLQELHKKKLQEELQDLNEQLKRQKHELATLQTEKERLLAESVDLNNQVQDYIEDVKLKQMEVYDYKKKVAETDAKMKMQMTLFEQVRRKNDRKKNSRLKICGKNFLGPIREESTK